MVPAKPLQGFFDQKKNERPYSDSGAGSYSTSDSDESSSESSGSESGDSPTKLKQFASSRT